MTGPAALLLFPLRPAAAVPALARRWLGVPAPLLPAGALFLYLWGAGCSTEDAAVTALAAAAFVSATGLLGAGACVPAGWLLGRRTPLLALLSPCMAAAGWAPVLFLLLLLAGRAAGFGSSSALFAGMALLVWGVWTGLALVGERLEDDRGKALVASCLGLAGALAGAWLGLAVVRGFVTLVPAPIATQVFSPGDLLLVRRGPRVEPGRYVLLRRPGTAEAAIGRTGADGTVRPVGDLRLPPEELRNWDIAGRLFFKFGARGGAIVGKARQTP